MTSASLERRIQTIKKLVDTPPYDVVIDELQNLYGTGVETIETIPSVLAVVQLANGEPTKSARISANIGADTDTIGAISTAICGAMNQSFEPEYIELLQTVNQLNFDEQQNNYYLIFKLFNKHNDLPIKLYSFMRGFLKSDIRNYANLN